MPKKKPQGHIKRQEFIDAVIANDYDLDLITQHFNAIGYTINLATVRARIRRMTSSGKLPLRSGNKPEAGLLLKKTSTMYDADGNVKLQWVSSEADKEDQLKAVQSAIESMVAGIESLQPSDSISLPDDDENITTYISSDVHIGALVWEPETGEDYDTDIAVERLKSSYDHLFATSPNSKAAIILDLGDLTEVDNFTGTTSKSGNILDTDSRFPKILTAAYQGLVYAIQKALTKHEIVYFYNIAGNHDNVVGHAVREIVNAYFRNEPRLIIDSSPAPIKYHQHGQTLLGFAHGDGLKMKDAGEVMAVDNEAIFSHTKHRFFLFGHIHKDSVHDGRLCKSESFRNIASLNAWAHHKGFRRQPGTMKSITYSATSGEVSRSTYNIPS